MLHAATEYAKRECFNETASVISLDATRLPAAGLDLKHYIETIELALMRQALERSEGVVARAARLLKLRRTTLVEKMRKYRNRGEDFGAAA